VLAKLDGRRREARLMQNVRDELAQHVGGNPSAPQRALIERAAWLTLHVALMDAKLMEEGEGATHSERDSRQYLAWSNSLTRIMKQLGTDKVPAKPRKSLADLIQEAGA
jgi:hypothetical protein